MAHTKGWQFGRRAWGSWLVVAGVGDAVAAAADVAADGA